MPRILEEFDEALRMLGEYSSVYESLGDEASEIKGVFEEELRKLDRDYFQAEYVSTFETWS